MQSKRLLAVLAAITLLSAFTGLASSPVEAAHRHRNRPRVPGMVIVESDRSFDETWTVLVDALNANPNIRLVAEIDHAAAAASVGLELGPNRVAVFGNPTLGTPLMQENQVVGIDLPQKIQVFEQHDRVWVGFNDTTYLAARHRLGEQPTLNIIRGALRTLAGTAADRDVDQRSFGNRSFKRHPGLVTIRSDADIDTTWDRLLAAIERSPASVAFMVDHQQGAASVNLDLRPTRLVVFGNPNLGTPLMQERPTVGIDLPLKILVWEDESGDTFVTTNDERLARRHKIRRSDLGPIIAAVENFLEAATTTP